MDNRRNIGRGGCVGASLRYDNGQAASFSYDQDHRLTAVDTTDGFTPAQNLALAHDAAGNVTAITDLLDAARTQSFGYDALNRLTDATGAYGDITYAYDPVGNRLTRTFFNDTATTEIYTHALDSNRLLSVDDGTTTRSLTYDPAGNTVTDDANGLALSYNDTGRLAAVDAGAVQLASYLHNALGERVAKQAGAQATHYHYDRDGILPLALIADAGGTPALRFVHADHLGTPQKMTDAAGQVVWDARFRPFGEAHALTGPAANDNRFPGQRLEAETGFHYNYFRDYDPTLGRYIQSDPIGLAAGLNTYGYAVNNPLGHIDPLGLQSFPPPPPNIPGGPWKWAPNPQNSRGGTYVDPDGRSATWDKKGNHWDVDDGKGNRQRYNRWGKPLTPGQAHNYKGPKQKPLNFPRKFMRGPYCLSLLLFLIELGVEVMDAINLYETCQEDPCLCDPLCA
jgi:RHS repeat-associated protein